MTRHVSPNANADSRGARARRDDSGWVLDGQKRFITNAPLADLFVVFARTLLRLYEGTSEIQRLIIGGSFYRDQRKAAYHARGRDL
jgi:alkylation response protein AidB-like acyl-CoA dehydrogenase